LPLERSLAARPLSIAVHDYIIIWRKAHSSLLLIE
jgi:hypothetical protein